MLPSEVQDQSPREVPLQCLRYFSLCVCMRAHTNPPLLYQPFALAGEVTPSKLLMTNTQERSSDISQALGSDISQALGKH